MWTKEYIEQAANEYAASQLNFEQSKKDFLAGCDFIFRNTQKDV
jgi:hypothetical protein